MSDKRIIKAGTFGWVSIITMWGALQLSFFLVYGINQHEEAEKYISAAQQLVEGGDLNLHQWWYSGYITTHALIKMFHLPAQSMYFLQLLLSLISVFYFMKIVSPWLTSRTALIISGLLYATCFIIQQWVHHLYTDPVFSSLLVVGAYFLLNEKRSSFHQFMLWCFIMILPFFRPVGILFSVLAIINWLFTFEKRNLRKMIAAAAYVAILAILVIRSLGEGEGYFYPNHNLEANIICGLPADLLTYQVVPFNKNGSIVAHLLNNPGMTARLFLLRFYKVFSLTRPFFSELHNLILLLSCIVYYTFAIAGVIHILRNRIADLYFLVAGCLLFAVPGVLFCVEWTGRMSVPVILFVLFLATVGIDQVVSFFLARNKMKR